MQVFFAGIGVVCGISENAAKTDDAAGGFNTCLWPDCRLSGQRVVPKRLIRMALPETRDGASLIAENTLAMAG